MSAFSPLRILRVLSGKTQRQLGAQIDRTPTWVSLAERGIEPLTPADVQRLAVALRVEPALLAPPQRVVVKSKGRRRVAA
jgi:transcriptional regulator with XRE-family HTH domain